LARKNADRHFPQAELISAYGYLITGSPRGASRVGYKAHIGEVQVSVWDEETLKVCQDAGVILL
jgi:aspartate--ammonia ligase